MAIFKHVVMAWMERGPAGPGGVQAEPEAPPAAQEARARC